MTSTNDLIIFAPFAYGGNPASESGPKCLFDILKRKNEFDNVEMLYIEQKPDESAVKYLKKVEKLFSKCVINYNKIIYIGGNHLSVFPIYRYLYSLDRNRMIVTLDAHRDYYPEKRLNHATFMKYLPNVSHVEHVLIGVRDFNKHNEKHKTVLVDTNYYKKKEMTKQKDISFLDIDIDVIDPVIFPWCGSTIDDGVNLQCVEQIILEAKQKGCYIMAVSEYIPNWDYEFLGAECIISMIKKMLF